MLSRWFKRGEEIKPRPPTPPRRPDLIQIPRQERLPPNAECFFDPFDIEVRKRSFGRLAQYRDVVVRESDVHPVAEEELPAEGEEKPAEKWEDDSTTSSPSVTTPTTSAAAAASSAADDVAPLPSDEEWLALIAKEKAAVADMRLMLGLTEPTDAQELHKENLAFLRFLRAREFRVVDAVEMYKKMKEWRREFGTDTLLDEEDPHEALFQCTCGHRNHGYSYEGHPVYYERTGLVNVAKMVQHSSEDLLVKRHVRFMEHAMRRCQYSSYINKRNVEKIIMVHDLAHLRFAVETIGVKIFTRTVTIDQQFYPERMHRVYIINAPLSFRATWAVVRPFIDPKTSQKIKILGGDFQKALLKEIPLDQLPEMYGGNCRCEHPNGDHCVSWVRPFPIPPGEEGQVPEPWPII